MSPYEQWQLENHGNVLPETEPLFTEDELQQISFEEKLAMIEWFDKELKNNTNE